MKQDSKKQNPLQNQNPPGVFSGSPMQWLIALLASWVASKYSLAKSEKKNFRKQYWSMYQSGQREILRLKKSGLLSNGFEEALDAYKQIIDSPHVNMHPELPIGHQIITRGDIGSSYIIFSDQHIQYSGHRQDLFRESGNQQLYLEIIEKYYDDGFTLVENGDVEDLVVHDPDHPMTESDGPNFKFSCWESHQSWREQRRHWQLTKILEDENNQPLYRMLRKFQDDARLVRTAGNHDYPLQGGGCLEKMREHLGDSFIPPCDYFLLGDAEKRPEIAIAHGHQFDTWNMSPFAGIGGEAVTESLGWAFTGPDRFWDWDPHGMHAMGIKGFNNELVSDQAPMTFIRKLLSTIGIEANIPSIAWEYYGGRGPLMATLTQILSGKQGVKFRHLNEILLCAGLKERFTTPPTLILGHTHEVRHLSTSHKKDQVDWYINSGAAGRFQNLIWGVEVVNGKACVVGWSREAGPGVGKPIRKVFQATDKGDGRALIGI
ncbi:MAG: hypothetical protein HOE90_12355 [Bacteriovoracaceae bacterium]|jgi:hypothetical protein|nr:hypothetical protein [Bacteriovoracaceae bacterium]